MLRRATDEKTGRLSSDEGPSDDSETHRLKVRLRSVRSRGTPNSN
jgi:hypothetical protein